MKRNGVGLLALFICCPLVLAQDVAAIKQAVKSKVTAMNSALLTEDFTQILDLSHPKIVELMGGRDKMAEAMKAGAKDMHERGFAVRSFTVSEPSEPVSVGTELYLVVPFMLEIKAPGGKILEWSYVVGTSGDQGRSWHFVNGDLNVNEVKQVIPNLPPQLKLPERKTPEFYKEPQPKTQTQQPR